MTYAFSTSGNFWKTRYSFEPDCYGASENYFVSFLPKALTGATGADLCWVHNTNQTRNSFYGDLYPSTISVVSNENPSAEKAYRALSIESNQNVFKAKVSTNLDLPNSSVTKPQTAEVRSFDAREEALYAAIGPSKTNSKKNVKVIGSLFNNQPFLYFENNVSDSFDKGLQPNFTQDVPSNIRFLTMKINPIDANEVALRNAAVAFEDGNTGNFYYIKNAPAVGQSQLTLAPALFNIEDCYAESVFRVATFRQNPTNFYGNVALYGSYLTLIYSNEDIGIIEIFDSNWNPINQYAVAEGPRRVIVVYDPELEGDPIRGRYARIDIETQADGKPFELLAVNTEYSMSNLDASK
jgi:hypothetical protein